MTKWGRWTGSRVDGPQEGGYVAVMTALLLIVLMGLSAFAVDVGNWYVVGQQEQRAADAAALAGVPSLPGDLDGATGAKANARSFSKINGFQDGVALTTVTPALDGGRSTRLRVTISRTVKNIFGPLLGVPTTIVTRSAVADFGGPIPMGSPCNEFGDDPDPTANKSANCADSGHFWANVGAKNTNKASGDAYQDNICASGTDNCKDASGNVKNIDYDINGYFYAVTLDHTVTNLTLQVFDPAWVEVGDVCEKKGLSGAVGTIYAAGEGSFCTGDVNISGAALPMATKFSVREWVPASDPWDPLTYPIVADATCSKVFQGFSGALGGAPDSLTAVSVASTAASPALQVKDVFRKWVTLCTIPSAAAGTYMIQVQSNGLTNLLGNSTDDANGHNRFSLRAYGASPDDKNGISIAGVNKMAMYANVKETTSKFFLAKVPSDVKGQIFNVRLFDIGDGAVSSGSNPSTIKILPPSELGTTAVFDGCKGSDTNPTIGRGDLPGCLLKVNNSFNGKWAEISVPIPPSYSCNDDVATGCWMRLQFFYGAGSTPNDTTSWTAGVDGDPVRLVE